ncbi:hypothetical protein BD408DRAFT_416842, partial [Parasitella parasitica]
MRKAVYIITNHNISLWLFYLLLCFLQTSFLLRPRSSPFLAKKDEHDLRYGII